MSTDEHTHGPEGAHTHGPEGAHTHGPGASHGHSHGAHDYEVPALPESVDIFDTILRDGSQQEGLSLTVVDKLRVAEQLESEPDWVAANVFSAPPANSAKRAGALPW